jgi:sirohydrochlorin cobaltochelatase
VGHGTRSQRGAAEFWTVVDDVRRRSACRLVEGCFLEMAEPSMADGVRAVYQKGGRRLVVAPLLLFAAAHAKSDVPGAVAEAAAELAGLDVRMAAPFGRTAAVVELSALRFDEAAANWPQRPLDETLLLMVGRGSRDAEASAEMAAVARMRFDARPCAWLEVAFTEMVEPSVETALAVVGQMPFARVVVQPHLLFHGFLTTRLERQVESARERFAGKEWLLVERLGPHALLAEALLTRVQEAAAADVDAREGATSNETENAPRRTI